jgi:hypothetical protein
MAFDNDPSTHFERDPRLSPNGNFGVNLDDESDRRVSGIDAFARIGAALARKLDENAWLELRDLLLDEEDGAADDLPHNGTEPGGPRNNAETGRADRRSTALDRMAENFFEHIPDQTYETESQRTPREAMDERHARRVAFDSRARSSFHKMFPEAARHVVRQF